MLSWVLALVLANSMPTIVIPQIKDESRTTLARHENTVTTERESEFFVETGEGMLLEGPFDTSREALIRSQARSLEFGVKDIGKLKDVIRLNEGVRHGIYLDKRKKVTVGVGFNLSRKDAGDKFRQAGIDVVALATKKVPLSHTQIEMLFDLSMMDVLKEVREVVKDFDSLSSGRQIALADMMFQLGKPKFLKFKRMLSHVNNKNWPKAAEQLLDSELALATSPDRARRNAERLLGVGLKRKISEPFFNPINPETGEDIFPSFDPSISNLFVPEDVAKVPVPKLQKKFDEELRKRLNALPLGELGRIALNQLPPLITESGLTIISRKDLIELVFKNLTLVARTKEL